MYILITDAILNSCCYINVIRTVSTSSWASFVWSISLDTYCLRTTWVILTLPTRMRHCLFVFFFSFIMRFHLWASWRQNYSLWSTLLSWKKLSFGLWSDWPLLLFFKLRSDVLLLLSEFFNKQFDFLVQYLPDSSFNSFLRFFLRFADYSFIFFSSISSITFIALAESVESLIHFLKKPFQGFILFLTFSKLLAKEIVPAWLLITLAGTIWKLSLQFIVYKI